MKQLNILFLLLSFSIGNSQSLSIDFEEDITTADFIDFNGGTAMVIDNPQASGLNTSATVAQIVRDGGDIWAGSKLVLAENLDFTTMSSISMKVFTTAPVGTVVKFKLEGNGSTERDVFTTVSNEWEVLTWDFTGEPSEFNEVVFMFDFGNTGDGSESSTFLFDDVAQLSGGEQLDLPVDFEDATINYTLIDFGGNASQVIVDPTDADNKVVQTIKTDQAEEWAGTTIGTAGGFKTNIPLTLSDSKMSVRVWSPNAGITVRLKVEDSNDVTHTCETEKLTTTSGDWETMTFDFTIEAPGTAALATGLDMGWTYNKASIFFNFGTLGSSVGEKTYYFDDLRFGDAPLSNFDETLESIHIFPNPTTQQWTITSENELVTKVELYNLQGQRQQLLYPQTNHVTLDASNLPNGIYISKVSTMSGSSIQRLVKG